MPLQHSSGRFPGASRHLGQGKSDQVSTIGIELSRPVRQFVADVALSYRNEVSLPQFLDQRRQLSLPKLLGSEMVDRILQGFHLPGPGLAPAPKVFHDRVDLLVGTGLGRYS